nr:GNAT family N-acetyltransferase [Arthrobacter sp. efr-133-R2A-120]
MFLFGNRKNRYTEFLMLLVAENGSGEVVGCVHAGPAEHIMETAMQNAPDAEIRAALAGFMFLTKLHGIAVRPDYRGRGVARALLQRVVEAYTRSGRDLLYGQYTATEDLGDFYRKQGFQVPGPGVGG